ncbi:hypothetical protein, partial [Thiolapillus sp.]
MKLLLLIPFVLLLHSCVVPYCTDYGYLDFRDDRRVEVVDYYKPNGEFGLKGVTKFPKSYRINMEKFQINIGVNFEYDAPAVSVDVTSHKGYSLELAAEGGNGCFRVNNREGYVDLWWDMRSGDCSSMNYPITFYV